MPRHLKVRALAPRTNKLNGRHSTHPQRPENVVSSFFNCFFLPPIGSQFGPTALRSPTNLIPKSSQPPPSFPRRQARKLVGQKTGFLRFTENAQRSGSRGAF